MKLDQHRSLSSWIMTGIDGITTDIWQITEEESVKILSSYASISRQQYSARQSGRNQSTCQN